MSELPLALRWFKCKFRVCDYYRVYLKLIGPRLTHGEYHKAWQDAIDHMVRCPRCGADPRQECETYTEWQKIWNMD